MKLAISNIAWEPRDDSETWRILRKHNVEGIEVAPTRLWPDWQGATVPAAAAYRRKMADEGFSIPAFQAILYGKPELQVFRPECHPAFLEHMKHVVDLAAAMGAVVLVFGAPKNRKRGQLSMSKALSMAVDLFRSIGEICHSGGCCIGWEHNPVEYGCDFSTSAADAREFVDIVAHAGVQLHLDSGALYLCGGDPAEIIPGVAPFCHYHASEPMLAPLAGGAVDHGKMLDALWRIGYCHWVSIEMKTCPAHMIEASLANVSSSCRAR